MSLFGIRGYSLQIQRIDSRTCQRNSPIADVGTSFVRPRLDFARSLQYQLPIPCHSQNFEHVAILDGGQTLGDVSVQLWREEAIQRTNLLKWVLEVCTLCGSPLDPSAAFHDGVCGAHEHEVLQVLKTLQHIVPFSLVDVVNGALIEFLVWNIAHGPQSNDDRLQYCRS